MAAERPRPDKPAAWRRWLGIALRATHLVSVTMLGAAVLGAPLALAHVAAGVLASGVALLVVETLDARLRWNELAGMISLAKLVVMAWMVLATASAPVLFWCVLCVSAISSHAPRRWRHWRPGAAWPSKRSQP